MCKSASIGCECARKGERKNCPVKGVKNGERF
jgi:hypothetical protein